MVKLAFEGVHYSYGSQAAVTDLTFGVEQGECLILIGPSGCGKTTTLKLVNRLLEPTQGRILFQGEDLRSFDPVKLRRSMGYVIQDVGLFPHWSVEENIATVPQLLKWPRQRVRDRVREMLELVGLKPDTYAVKLPHQLSGGESQRVGIARALAADPPLLLMDEPFGALDPMQRSRHQRLLKGIQARVKKTILLVTHDLDEAILLADRMLVMNQGRLVQLDTPGSILRSPANAFVRKFVGTDRSLKRLIRLTAREYLNPALPLRLGSHHLEDNGRFWGWVVDEQDRFVGWVNFEETERAGWEDAVTALAWEECATLETNLKDALSMMLALGMQHLPVVGDGGKLLGELNLAAIQALLREEEGPAT